MSSVRVEHKFLITQTQYFALKKIFFMIFPSDTFKSYPISSLYYDTIQHDYFYQKVNGEHRHLKIRIRKYIEDFQQPSPTWLETKIKINDRITKVRKPYTLKSLFPNPEDWPLESRRDLFVERAFRQIEPSCFVNYDREAFEMIQSHEKLRITFDQNISSHLPQDDISNSKKIFSATNSKNIMMEIKFPHETFPLFLQSILKQFSLKRVYFSKYAQGLNFLKQLV